MNASSRFYYNNPNTIKLNSKIQFKSGYYPTRNEKTANFLLHTHFSLILMHISGILLETRAIMSIYTFIRFVSLSSILDVIYKVSFRHKNFCNWNVRYWNILAYAHYAGYASKTYFVYCCSYKTRVTLTTFCHMMYRSAILSATMNALP